MAAYNAGRWLDETLASVRAQTLRDFELLLIDDGSTDGTADIARRHASEDARLRFVSQAHAGVAATRNHGLSLARGRWIALWDDDDLCEPRRLERQIAFLEANPDVGVLGTYAWHIGVSGRRVGVSDIGPVTRREFATSRAADLVMYLAGSSAVFDTKRALAAGGFSAGMVPAEDADLWTRLSDDTIVLALPERLVSYRVHASSASTNRFFEQMEKTDLIAANAKRRRAGRSELAPAAWHAMMAEAPLTARVRRARLWRSRYYYRLGGGLLADRRASGIVFLALAAALAPLTVVGRLRRQKALHFFPRAHR